MDDQLYFFEVLVDNIYFEEAVQTIPTKKNIVVTVNLGNIVTLEIRSGSLPSVGEGPMKRFVDFKAGRSYLCSMSSLKLLNVIQKENVIVTVGVRDDVKPIGTSNLPWDDTFKEMVQASIETREFVTPALIYDNLALLEDGTIKGNIQTYLRLSCFGNEIQTHFDVLQESGNTQFIFKSPNVASTFVCSKYNPGEQSSDFIPLGPLYNALTLRPDTHDRASSVMPQSTSMTALMDKKYSQARESVMSEIVYSDFFNMPAATMKESANTFDIVSLRFRPEDDRFLDFLTGKKLADLDLASVQKFSVADTEGNEKVIFCAEESILTNEASVMLAKEAAKAEKPSKTCQCPKQLSVCHHVLDAIELYEKSHPNLKIRGRRVDYKKLWKIKKADILRLRGGNDREEDLPPYILKKPKGCLEPNCKMAWKLRSVGIRQITSNVKKTNLQKKKTVSFCQDFFCPENLKRNVSLQVVFSEDEVRNLEFKCPSKYCPAAKKFKELGLGPLAIEKCQGVLYGPVKSPVQYGLSQTYGTFDTYGPFGILSETDTPDLPKEAGSQPRGILRLRGGGEGSENILECFKINFSKFLEEQRSTTTPETLRLRGAGESRSPAIECQEIMNQFDRILEDYRAALESCKGTSYEDYMEHSISPNCGHPHCTYISEMPLPPIHWDCPNPLPEGICENPQCPYLPPDLKRIIRILEEKRANRTLESCPEFTNNCPFENRSPVVNMMQFENKSKNYCQNPQCTLRVEPVCSSPDCPFANNSSSNNSSECSNPRCPFARNSSSGDASECSNPDCPFKLLSDECSNPECPYRKDSDKEMEENVMGFQKGPDGSILAPCTIKTCIHKEGSLECDICSTNITTSENSECQCNNPECPDQIYNKCSNPECPFNLKTCEICANPKCPYKNLDSSKKKGVCSSPNVCGDATCPFQFKEEEEQGAEAKILLDAVYDGDVKIEEGEVVSVAVTRRSIYDMDPCMLQTCHYLGGKIKCTDCATVTDGKRRKGCPKICLGDDICPLSVKGGNASVKHSVVSATPKEFSKKALKRAKRQYLYHFGDKYPGRRVGHQECITNAPNVPPKMGWLWNLDVPCVGLKRRKGWRPGAMGKTILEAIQAHRKALNLPPFEMHLRKRRKRYGTYESEIEMIRPKPTLEIKKREGVYFITMNPLKDPKTLTLNENPYMDVKPLQFKIKKNKPKNEFKTCVCNDQGVLIEPESSSTESELDIELTPPAGIIRPERFLRIRDVIHIETQYDQKDFVDLLEKKEDEFRREKAATKQKKEKTGGKGGKEKKKGKKSKK